MPFFVWLYVCFVDSRNQAMSYHTFKATILDLITHLGEKQNK